MKNKGKVKDEWLVELRDELKELEFQREDIEQRITEIKHQIRRVENDE
jgi:septal ring factor EnvC (AmiA/AmiB activator)